MTQEHRDTVDRLVRRHASQVGTAADYSYPDLNQLADDCGFERTSEDWSELLNLTVGSMVDVADEHPRLDGMSRWWSQLLNRLTDRVVMASDASEEGSCRAVNSAVETVRAGAAPDLVVADALASMCGALAWGYFGSDWGRAISESGALAGDGPDRGAGRSQPFLADRTADSYLRLYLLRFQLRPERILRVLAGQDYRSNDAIKAAFASFARGVTGDWRAAAGELAGFADPDRLPLASAKLVSTALEYSPPPALDDGERSDVLRVLEVSLATWRDTGGDVICLTASAEYAAMVGDERAVNAFLDQAAEVIEQKDVPVFDDYASIAARRARLLERISIRRDLAEVSALKADAAEALDAARSASSQVPTIVGLFTAVIALVVGGSQIQSGLDVGDRILVVAGLGAVLLGFVACLAVVSSLNTTHRAPFVRMSAFALGVVGLVAVMLTVIWNVAT